MARPTGGKAKPKPKAAKVAASKKSKHTPFTFTPEKQAAFLAEYAQGGSVNSCAKKIGVASVTIFSHVRNDEEFAKKYRSAQELNVDQLEDVLEAHALTGNVTAIFGCLRARRPAVWRETHGVQISASAETAAAFFAAMNKVQGSATAT